MLGKQFSGNGLEKNYSGAPANQDDEDEIVAEFDVVLAGQMRDDIHLL